MEMEDEALEGRVTNDVLSFYVPSLQQKRWRARLTRTVYNPA